MSRPASSWSRRKQVSASSYCSRKRRVTIASRKCRVPRFSVYQLGRGSEPVMVVGRMMSLVARYMAGVSRRVGLSLPASYGGGARLGNRPARYLRAPHGKSGGDCPLEVGKFRLGETCLL